VIDISFMATPRGARAIDGEYSLTEENMKLPKEDSMFLYGPPAYLKTCEPKFPGALPHHAAPAGGQPAGGRHVRVDGCAGARHTGLHGYGTRRGNSGGTLCCGWRKAAGY
jgi:hypothetical protein